MMHKPRALVLTGYGINTDYETAHAFGSAVRARSGEREDCAVMIGVGVHVDERVAARLRERSQANHVASLGHVGDALQHAGSVGAAKADPARE